MLILVDDPLLYDTADTSDSTDLLIMNNPMLVSSHSSVENVKLSADPKFMLRKTSNDNVLFHFCQL